MTLCLVDRLRDQSLGTYDLVLALCLRFNLRSLGLGLFVDFGDRLYCVCADNLKISTGHRHLLGEFFRNGVTLLVLVLLDQLK